jgi:peptidoglycan/LPS O-acetylase OafA/YrhL
MKYYSKINTLRAVAILAVMLSHWLPKESVIQKSFPFGFWGVNMFFVISGFLITGILLKSRIDFEKDQTKSRFQSILRFVYRRSLRIFPLYYVTLIPFYIFDLNGFRDNFINHVSYLSNIQFFVQNSMQGGLSPRWSLAVEEQFYLLWPFLIMFLPTKYFTRIFLSFIVIAFLFRIGVQMYYPEKLYFQFLTPSNIDAFSVGAILALVKSNLDVDFKWITRLFKFNSFAFLSFVFLFCFVFSSFFIDKTTLLYTGLKNSLFTISNLFLLTFVININEKNTQYWTLHLYST